MIFLIMILLESAMFGMVVSEYNKKIALLITGVLAMACLTLSRVLHSFTVMFGVFLTGHILLFAIYVISSYRILVDQVEEQDLTGLLRKYVKIPTWFYFIPVLAVLYILAEVSTSEDMAGVLLILALDVAAVIYNFLENKKINRLSNQQLTEKSSKELRQLVYRKNALVVFYSLMFSISMGILYLGIFDFKNVNIGTLIFILELMVNSLICFVGYYKVREKFLAEDAYPKWQLMVPKRVGIGYTLNIDCPFTYVIMGIVAVVIIISIL